MHTTATKYTVWHLHTILSAITAGSVMNLTTNSFMIKLLLLSGPATYTCTNNFQVTSFLKDHLFKT